MKLRLPSPGLAVGIVALVVAMTSSAVAASLITSKQIKNGTIQLKDISKQARSALKGQKGATGRPGATGAQGAQGAAGLPGAKGDKGDPGAPGVTTVTVRRANLAVPGGGVQSVGGVPCPAGSRATGGGFHAGGPQLIVNQSAPSSDGGSNLSADASTPNSWRVQIFNSGADTTGIVFVICAAP